MGLSAHTPVAETKKCQHPLRCEHCLQARSVCLIICLRQRLHIFNIDYTGARPWNKRRRDESYQHSSLRLFSSVTMMNMRSFPMVLPYASLLGVIHTEHNKFAAASVLMPVWGHCAHAVLSAICCWQRYIYLIWVLWNHKLWWVWQKIVFWSAIDGLRINKKRHLQLNALATANGKHTVPLKNRVDPCQRIDLKAEVTVIIIPYQLKARQLNCIVQWVVIAVKPKGGINKISNNRNYLLWDSSLFCKKTAKNGRL